MRQNLNEEFGRAGSSSAGIVGRLAKLIAGVPLLALGAYALGASLSSGVLDAAKIASVSFEVPVVGIGLLLTGTAITNTSISAGINNVCRLFSRQSNYQIAPENNRHGTEVETVEAVGDIETANPSNQQSSVTQLRQPTAVPVVVSNDHIQTT